MKIINMTTIDERNSSLRCGQETLFISASTEIKKSAKLGNCTTRKLNHKPNANTASGSPN